MRKIGLVFLVVFMLVGASAWADDYAKTQYPIVLVPGVTGFDSLLGIVDYWYGMVDDLEDHGAKVYQVALTGWNGVYEGEVLPDHNAENLRGPQLERLILAFMNGQNRWGQVFSKVNIIAHSHGSTTSRYFMNRHPDKVASLTTIAGPHKGTPSADFAWDCMDQNTQNFLAGGINFFMGDLIAFLSGHWEYIGTQDTWLTVNHFRKDGITAFNQNFPCPGLPYSLQNGQKVYNEGLSGGYGGLCTNNGAPDGWMEFNDPVTAEHRSGHIYFFSWTGNIGHGNITNIFDVVDLFLVATNKMNEGYSYYGDADAFIPVASANFGNNLCSDYYWNHVDEINHTLGLRWPWSANPVTVVRNHANRLKNMGL